MEGIKLVSVGTPWETLPLLLPIPGAAVLVGISRSGTYRLSPNLTSCR